MVQPRSCHARTRVQKFASGGSKTSSSSRLSGTTARMGLTPLSMKIFSTSFQTLHFIVGQMSSNRRRNRGVVGCFTVGPPCADEHSSLFRRLKLRAFLVSQQVARVSDSAQPLLPPWRPRNVRGWCSHWEVAGEREESRTDLDKL